MEFINFLFLFIGTILQRIGEVDGVLVIGLPLVICGGLYLSRFIKEDYK